jgi:dolichyl-phosphate-mannose--protein O-mannosyl transferase
VGAMLVQLLLVSAVVMGLSHTIAKERIFDPLRKKAGGIRTWQGYLVACPYCASHWLAFVLVPLTGTYLIHVVPRLPVASAVLDWFLSSILVTVVAAFLRVGFYVLDERQRLTRKRLVDDAHDRQPPLVQ